VTVLALHHPPVSTGIAAWDEIGLPVADRRALSVSNQIVNDRPCVLTVLVDSHRDEIATRR
jgi:hypothetical protein